MSWRRSTHSVARTCSIQLPSFFRRELYALLLLAALVSFAWLARPSRVGPLLSQNRKVRILLIGIRAGLVSTGRISRGKRCRICFLAQVLGLECFGWILRGRCSLLRRPRLDLDSQHRPAHELGAVPCSKCGRMS